MEHLFLKFYGNFLTTCIKNLIYIILIATTLLGCQENNKTETKSRICNKSFCEEGTLINGNKNGIWKRFDKNDNLIQINFYTKDTLNGPSVSFYDNGEIYNSVNYKMDEFHGNVSLYYDNGNLNFSDNYINGNKHGKSFFFDKEGWLKEIRSYHQGEKHGKHINLNKRQDTVEIKVFKLGKLIK